MSAKLLFIHGTGARETSGLVEQITKHAAMLGFPPSRVASLDWGVAVGPAELDMLAALPPSKQVTRGIGEDLSEAEEQAALWDLLLADPLVELRLLGANTSGENTIGFAADLASVRLQQRLEVLTLSADSLARAEIPAEEVRAAAAFLRDCYELTDAADRIGDPDDPELVVATARALCALALVGQGPAIGEFGPLPRAAYDGQARDKFVGDVAEGLHVGTRGLGGDLLKKIVAPTATKVAVAMRTKFTVPMGNFLRDIAFYIAHGDEVRGWLADQIREHNRDGSEVVLLAHSLGGIAAVDLLSDPELMGTIESPAPGRLNVSLLITVGSQSPLLFLMDALQFLRPGTPRVPPFAPWLNIYNRDDLLSFCAERVWPGRSGIVDVPVSPGVPFPASHSAYFANEDMYQEIRSRYPRLGGGLP